VAGDQGQSGGDGGAGGAGLVHGHRGVDGLGRGLRRGQLSCKENLAGAGQAGAYGQTPAVLP